MQSLRLLYLVYFVCSFSFSQEINSTEDASAPYYQKQKISKENLENYKNKEAFNYKIKKADENSLWIKFKRWVKGMLIKFFSGLFGMDAATGILWFILRILPYILLGILIVLLLRFFLKVNSRNILYGEQKRAEIYLTDEEQIIKNEDINALIADAVKQENYRLALRYYYLLTIKELSAHHIIDWQQQKTNDDYIQEIKTSALQAQFSTITKIYNYVWYGGFEVDALKFESLKLEFINFNTQVKH